MGVNIQEVINNEIIGNIKIGARNKEDRPVKYGYFNVHIDNMTSSLAVELFNQVYDKPKKLKIRFINQNPMEVHLERYSGKKRACYGNNKEAVYIDNNGKKQKISCNIKECDYAQSGECKYIGRLYFVLDKLEDEGVWCYPTGNQKGISKILQRIIRANRIGEDLTKDWYELFLTPMPSSYKGVNYIPDIRKVETVNSVNNQEDKKQPSQDTVKQQKPNFLMLKSFMMTIFQDKKVPKIKFKNTDNQEVELILLENAKQDILNLTSGSVILPLKTENIGKDTLLIDYRVIKAFSNEIENQKAV